MLLVIDMFWARLRVIFITRISLNLQLKISGLFRIVKSLIARERSPLLCQFVIKLLHFIIPFFCMELSLFVIPVARCNKRAIALCNNNRPLCVLIK